ncbi:MAG TPA: helix-turn-helix transcriptional regulator [Puia sp.]
MHVISEIDHFLAFLQSPIRSRTNEFIAFELEDYDEKPHIHAIDGVKTLFYRISIIKNDSVDFSINNGIFQASKSYTLCFFSPFHYVSVRQKSNLQGQSLQFSESFVHCAYESTRFHKDFPFFWSDDNFFFIGEQEARTLVQLGEKIIHEYNTPSRFSENIIRDYLHIFLLVAKEIIGIRDVVQDSSADYSLFRQFFMLVNKSRPVIRTVEQAATILAITPARLWLIVKRLSGQTPLEIINQRVLRDAQAMLLSADLNVSEVGFQLEFREKSHFTRFFKNLTGLSPLEYIRQSGFRNR